MTVNPIHSVSMNTGDDRVPASPSTPSSSSESFSLGELLDIVNPLQHIPGVNTVYREITGDEASVRSRIAGSSLYGMIAGPLGMAGLVAGNLAEMKVSGVLDAEAAKSKEIAASEETSPANIIEAKISKSTPQPEPAIDMATSLQRGIPILPVSSTDIPPLFGATDTVEQLATGNESKLIKALSKSADANKEAQAATPETSPLPSVDKLSQDARNFLPEVLLRQLQERHRNNLTLS